MRRNGGFWWIDTLHGNSNASRVGAGVFSGSTADELDHLGDAIVAGDEIFVDSEGVLHTQRDVENLSSLNTANMTKVNADPFAGGDEEFLFYEEEAALTGNHPTVDGDENSAYPPIDPVFEEQRGVGSFGFADFSQSAELDDTELRMDQEGILSEDVPEENRAGGNRVMGTNLNKVNSDPFAAISKPSNPDQWYNINNSLFVAEVANMRRSYPNAMLGFFKSTGDMYWIITAKVAPGITPWTFLLEYMKDHPNNRGYGGSIHVQLLKSPSLNDLRERAKANGRPGVPHIVNDKRPNGEDYQFLCTRRPQDVNSGAVRVTSAVQVAGWAADWALHFENGLRRKDVWNKWCDDEHFRHLQV